MMMPATLQILLSVFAISLVSFAGVFLLSIHQPYLRHILLSLVSFAVGALFANVFLHILPEAIEITANAQTTFALVLLGIVLSFVIEKFIHWHHCHRLDCRHIHPAGTMILIGDGIHNAADGMLIAAAYLTDAQLGVAATIAVILHEIPQEVGDFAVLLQSGYSRFQALSANFCSALTAFLGAALVLLLSERVFGLTEILLPITAGNLLYIAGADLIPELHKESRIKNILIQLVAMLAGILLMYVLSL